MKQIITVIALLAGSSAYADGFVCTNVDGDLKIKVFNHVQPEVGTRTGAIMIVSDPTISHGRKTIATFNDASLLQNEGASYMSKVDLRFSNSNRSGESVGGSKLGNLKEIILDVDFLYGDNLQDGDITEGTAILVRRSGSTLYHDMECVRYLKD